MMELGVISDGEIVSSTRGWTASRYVRDPTGLQSDYVVELVDDRTTEDENRAFLDGSRFDEPVAVLTGPSGAGSADHAARHPLGTTDPRGEDRRQS